MQYHKHIEKWSKETSTNDLIDQTAPKVLTPCSDYSAVARKPNHDWTSNQRVLLAWLALSYNNSWADLATIFNAYFQDELLGQNALSLGAFTSMWYCMELRPDEEAALSALKTPDLSRNNVGFQNSARAFVKRLAVDLEIELIDRQLGAPMRAKKAMNFHDSHLMKRNAANLDDSVLDNDPTTSLPITMSQMEVRTPDKSHLNLFPQTPTQMNFQDRMSVYPTPSSSERPKKQPKLMAPDSSRGPVLKQASTHKKLAALGFRAFSDVS